MYQSKLIYKFESNKEENMSYLTIALRDDPSIWILKVECYKYIPKSKVEHNTHTIVNWMLHSPICDKTVNEDLMGKMF